MKNEEPDRLKEARDREGQCAEGLSAQDNQCPKQREYSLLLIRILTPSYSQKSRTGDRPPDRENDSQFAWTGNSQSERMKGK